LSFFRAVFSFRLLLSRSAMYLFSFNLSGLLSAGLSPAPAHSICSQLHLPSSAAASGSAASPITHGGASAELLKESLTRRSMILTAAQ